MKLKTTLLIGFLVIIGLSNLTYASGSLMNQMFIDNKELYRPIVTEKFSLHEKGFSKSFELKYKYKDRYSFGIINADIGFPDSYEFNGVLKLEFYAKDEKLFEQLVKEQDVRWVMTGKKDYFKQITFSYFEIPLQGKYKKDISVKATVIEPDTNLNEFGSDIKVVIGVSATP